MATVLIVEDDTSLSEIYKIRLEAAGYRVVTALDGEEGLAAAIHEKPDLILSDVMMPRVSGFDMLDILKSTPNTRDIKVIMMTALSGDDQRDRGTSLGADEYLVKSQIGIEDVVAAVQRVLAGGAAPAPAPAPVATAPAPVAPAAAEPAPVAVEPVPAVPAESVAPVEPAVPAEPATTPAVIAEALAAEAPVSTPTPEVAPDEPAAPEAPAAQ